MRKEDKMKKILIASFIVLLLITTLHSNEKNIADFKEMYLKFHEIMYYNNKEVDHNRLHIAVDYAVEIMEKKPQSLEAYYVEKAFLNTRYNIEKNEFAYKKIKEMKNKYNDHIGDRNTDSPSKVLFLIIFLRNHYEPPIKLLKQETYMQEKSTYESNIRNIAKNRSDKINSALASLALIDVCMFHIECAEYFIATFPEHPARPIVELYILTGKNSKLKINDAHEDSIIALVQKYGEIMLPTGWKFKTYCYNYLAQEYHYINRYDKLTKYIALIKSETGIVTDDVKIINNMIQGVNSTF